MVAKAIHPGADGAQEGSQEATSSHVPLLLQHSRQQDAATRVQLFLADRSRSNRIRTNKYTWYSFVPMNLFEQFSQLGNAYFLLVALLQMIPAISNTGGRPLTLIPLSFVILMGAIKDAFEDLQRFLSDRRENSAEAVVVDEDLHETAVRWQDIHPGMVLRVQEGERVPADALVLATDLADGECFVETASLDGESNLKKKVAATTASEWRALLSQPVLDGSRPALAVEVERPSVDLYRFNGAMEMPDAVEPRGIHIGNVLLRGTSLQRTGRVYCLVLYCGGETRAMQNSQAARFKASKLDTELNRVVLLIFAMQFTTCFLLSLCSVLWRHWAYNEDFWYLELEPTHSVLLELVVRRIGTWLLQTNNMVPVSLMVTLTCVKFVQGVFIAWDEACGDVSGGKPARVNTSQVIESLGQITHVFSDKTGTLTQNLMEYRACSVAGRIYGFEDEEQQPSSPGGLDGCGCDLGCRDTATLHFPHVHFNADQFRRDLMATEDVRRQATLASFLLCQALCHSVEVEGGEDAHLRGSRASMCGTAPLYNGSSPDELALVYMAHAMGLEFLRISEGRATLRVRDAVLVQALEAACGGPSRTSTSPGSVVVDILDVCEFDNDRKRSSVVVKYPDGRLVLLLKGADTAVLPYVIGDVDTCEDHLLRFAQRGLRTLCLACRSLSQEEYDQWHSRYMQAQALVSSSRAVQVAKLAEELETHRPSELLGATAIEDKLQDLVPETIEQLRLAGMSVWMLTGDKVETAISIARSCKLLTAAMENVVLEDTGPAHIEEALQHALRREGSAITAAGGALTTVLATEELRKLFVEAALRCRAVICCRVSPKQKADVVQLVKTYKADATTLSIGDGANDVSMIVAAHVGVGISGKEGAQAASTADFAIAEFRFLRRLLFVHGRESYRRSSVVVLYNFYKNVLLVAPTILFAPVSGFTGQNLFYPWLCQLYNVFYTHVPVCLFGILDRATANLDDLEVQSDGYGPQLFDRRRAGVWIVVAVLQAGVMTVVATTGFSEGHTPEGNPSLEDLRSTGFLRFFWVVLCANAVMALRQSCWHALFALAYMANILAAVGSIWLFDAGTMQAMLGSNVPRVFLTTVLVLIINIFLGETLIRWSHKLGVRNGVAAAFEAPASPGGGARELREHTSSCEVELSVAGGTSLQASLRPQASGSNPTGTSQRSPSRMSSFGYAFSQECSLERASVSSTPQS